MPADHTLNRHALPAFVAVVVCVAAAAGESIAAATACLCRFLCIHRCRVIICQPCLTILCCLVHFCAWAATGTRQTSCRLQATVSCPFPLAISKPQAYGLAPAHPEARRGRSTCSAMRIRPVCRGVLQQPRGTARQDGRPLSLQPLQLLGLSNKPFHTLDGALVLVGSSKHRALSHDSGRISLLGMPQAASHAQRLGVYAGFRDSRSRRLTFQAARSSCSWSSRRSVAAVCAAGSHCSCGRALVRMNLDSSVLQRGISILRSACKVVLCQWVDIRCCEGSALFANKL